MSITQTEIDEKERTGKRRRVDDLYLKIKDLYREVAEVEAEINQLLSELGDEV